MLNVLVTGGGYEVKHFDLLKASGFGITHIPEDISQLKLQEILPDFDAYILGGDEKMSKREFTVAKALQVISFVGTGYSSFIDEEAASEAGVVIKNTPAVMAPAVAEHTVGMIIGMQRKLFMQNSFVKSSQEARVHTNELSSRKIGIVGMGAIGTRVATILRNAFDCEVVYFNRSRKPELEVNLAIKALPLDTLFATVDIVVLCLPTNIDTEYLVDKALLRKMQEHAILVNTAGARLVEPKALKEWLQNSTACAAFDGYYQEPLPKVNEDQFGLLALPGDKFIVTPHTAAKTSQSWNRMVDMAVNNLINFNYIIKEHAHS